MEFSVEKLYGMYCIVLPDQLGKQLIAQYGKRLLCHFNHKVTTHSALMPIKDGGYYITIGKAYLKQLGANEGALLSVSFEKDTAEIQFEIPEELTAVLETDKEANTVFSALTVGKKRSLAYLVSAVKSQDKRIERALLIAEKIKLGITSPQQMLKT